MAAGSGRGGGYVEVVAGRLGRASLCGRRGKPHGTAGGLAVAGRLGRLGHSAAGRGGGRASGCGREVADRRGGGFDPGRGEGGVEDRLPGAVAFCCGEDFVDLRFECGVAQRETDPVVLGLGVAAGWDDLEVRRVEGCVACDDCQVRVDGVHCVVVQCADALGVAGSCDRGCAGQLG